jgi:hypothetical protein
MDGAALGGEWNSGEELPVLLTDADVNLNSRVDEDISVADGRFTIYPSLRIGSPITQLGGTLNSANFTSVPVGVYFNSTSVDLFSDVLRANVLKEGILGTGSIAYLNVTLTGTTGDELGTFIHPGTTKSKFAFFNYDIRSFEDSLNTTPFTIRVHNASHTGGAVVIGSGITDYQGMINVTNSISAPPVFLDDNIGGTEDVEVSFGFNALPADSRLNATTYTAVADFFSFGQSGDGNLPSERFNNAIYRLELEETGDNTSQFEGTVEYTMLNQLNVNQTLTYIALTDPISDAIEIIVHEDLTDEDSPRINYRDVGADG